MLLATVASWVNSLCDPACILEAGCHEFVRKKSYILYRRSRIETLAALRNGVERGALTKLEDMPSSVLRRVRAGFETSEQTPLRILRYYQARKRQEKTKERP